MLSDLRMMIPMSCSSCVSAFGYLTLSLGHSLAYSDVQQYYRFTITPIFIHFVFFDQQL